MDVARHFKIMEYMRLDGWKIAVFFSATPATRVVVAAPRVVS